MIKNKGFNLIELLVALVVISISLFAVAKVQISGMQGMETAKEATSSAVNITNLIERLSKQRDALRVYLNGSDEKYKQNNLASETIINGACTKTPTKNAANAKNAIGCEIDAWANSMVESLNLGSKADLAYGVTIDDEGDYSYTKTIKYTLPRITIAVMWKKNPGATMNETDYELDDNGLMTPPGVDSELGYMSMEYIAP